MTAGFVHNIVNHTSPALESLALEDITLDISPSSVTTPLLALRLFKAAFICNFEDLGLLLRLFPNLDDTLVIKVLHPQKCRLPYDSRTNAKEAFLLALQCPIQRLELEDTIASPEDKEYLIDVLRDNSPHQINISLDVSRCDVTGLFPLEAAEKLTHLVLCLSFQIEGREGYDARRNRKPWHQFLDGLVDSMKHLRLTHLRLVLQYEVLRDQDPPLGGVDADAVYFARGEDLHGVAMRFFGAMSILQCALLAICGYTSLFEEGQSSRTTSRWLSSKAWRIAGANACEDPYPSNRERGLTYLEISSEEAEVVVNGEEMHLGNREQFVARMCLNKPEDPGKPRLNFDVLRSICNELTEVSDVLSFALTCSTLRKGALQRRLRMSSVFLSGPDSVQRFHKFIFADPTSRAPYIYGLTLYPHSNYAPNGDPHFQKCLVAILEAAVRLEHLDFPTTIGHSVCSAVTKMTTLRELAVVSDANSYDPHNPEPLSDLLTALRSPLQYLGIAGYESGQISASFLHYHLPHFASTLESLRLGDFSFNIISFAVTTPFTAMRSLHLSSMHQAEFYRLDVLLRLFPNLDDTLVLKGYSPSIYRYPLSREQSKEVQRDYTWPGLYRVTYSVALAFMMALRCPIRSMVIYGSVREEAQYLTEVLRDNCPQQLLLPIALFGHDHLQVLDELFPPEAGDRLMHLVLFFEVDVNRRRQAWGQYNNFSWDQFMDTFVHAMKHLRRLTHLRVVLYYNIHPLVSYFEFNSKQSRPNAPPELHDDEAFAQNIAHDADLYPAATRLLNTLASLEYVLMTTCGLRRFGEPWKYWHSSRAWRVKPAEVISEPEDPRYDPLDGAQTWDSTRSRSCEEMSSEAAEAVIDKEELHLDQREENMVRECIKFASK
ncbi:hypothetical protein GSI_05826 [Ganoderma sinense ZZ0214-1]|uniref:Uncharacterized protein n=1 Tax=Ganoderma sinense ZZ0214-1 TaxID=1077348 RepID=A0A2G8SBJ7_9APHY|nr:hypothetical protein GSI_05826 [Ganoderma sinense ZZ0214-1]